MKKQGSREDLERNSQGKTASIYNYKEVNYKRLNLLSTLMMTPYLTPCLKLKLLLKSQ